MAEVPQSALSHSQYQVVCRHSCCGTVVLTGDDMKTAAIKTVDQARHRSCEGPGLTRMREFALDHTHYCRWLSVHIRDMTSLSVNHPNIHAKFRAGTFVMHKTRNKFSTMAIDQCHEQNNGAIKGSRGAVGLTANPAALRC